MSKTVRFERKAKDLGTWSGNDSEEELQESRSSQESDGLLLEKGSGPRPSSHKAEFDDTKPAVGIAIFMASLLLFATGIASLVFSWQHARGINAQLKELSMHSPLLNKVEIPLVERMSTAQYGMGGNGIWRKEPGPEVDEAWERVAAEYVFPVTKADIIAMRKDPSVAVEMPEKYDEDGEKTYMAKLGVFHNIHCLDYVRKAVYSDYYYPNGTDDNPLHMHHVAHCIMVLFEHLTCFGDPSVYLFRWQDELDRPVGDTNVWRKCWDFETVLDDLTERSITDMAEDDLTKPAGAKSVPAADDIMEILKEYRKTHPGWGKDKIRVPT
ncbi:hypothetical protein CCHL11_01310 [Colletotrichum chlorophyti]|uniref:Tat pathway signal sequence n=1 Tax=Colletotrichum chlorophyti TaxID=708187 RepID=A0A1Q8RYW4_9PEZI|nr:hypothetical protein CCHL11_01310 [Colletotrichum chlorophyti]